MGYQTTEAIVHATRRLVDADFHLEHRIVFKISDIRHDAHTAGADVPGFTHRYGYMVTVNNNIQMKRFALFKSVLDDGPTGGMRSHSRFPLANRLVLVLATQSVTVVIIKTDGLKR